ncbi:MAG: YceI family protein [Alphaproteobacteria bacterium]|nr:YceI family protein [Alphaproteobacteria bacterium]
MDWRRKILSIALSLAALSWVSQPLRAADVYGFDKGHTEIIFKWNHVGLSTQSGEFRDYDGTVSFDRENLANSSVDVTIKAASLDTGVKDLDDHLKSADFFEVETYPEITFKSTSVKQTGVDRGEVAGDLTIHGVTKPVSLDVKLQFEGDHPLGPFIEAYAGAPYVAFSARTEILRSDFGVGAFAPLTSDRVEIVIETELRQQN